MLKNYIPDRVYSLLFEEKKASDTVDLTMQVYNPEDATQVKLILDEIKKFNQLKKPLLKSDQKIILGFLVLEFLWATGYVGNLWSALLNTAGALLVYSKRQESAVAFQKQLMTLYNLYYWCALNKGIHVTKDIMDENNIKKTNPFLKILETIYPFIPTKDLLLWNDFRDFSRDDIGQTFVDILAKPPHCQHFVGLKSSSSNKANPWFWKAVDTRLAPYGLPLPPLQNAVDEVSELWALTRAELRKKIYGYKAREHIPQHLLNSLG